MASDGLPGPRCATHFTCAHHLSWVYISGSVAFLAFWKRFAIPKLGEGSDAFRGATLEKLYYSAETLRVTGRIIEQVRLTLSEEQVKEQGDTVERRCDLGSTASHQ
jgi:hypothetical protein